MRTNTDGQKLSRRRFKGSKLILILAMLFAGNAMAKNTSRFSLNKKTSAQKKKAKKFNAKLALGLGGESFNETNISSADDESFVTQIRLDSKIQYKLSDKIKFKVDSRLRFLTGSVQLNYREDFSDSILRVYQATTQYNPVKALAFNIGLVNQGTLNSPLLIANRAFPGVSGKYKYISDNKKFGASIKAQYTMPTFQSFNDDRTENEELPTFSSVKLLAGLNLTNNINVQAYGTYFSYSDLPAVVAQRSSELGNSISGTLANARFVNEFGGYVAGGILKFKTNSGFNLKLDHQILTNTEADANKNGRHTRFSIAKDFEPVGVKVLVEDFFKDRDVVPSVYSNLFYGGNNRQGQMYGVDLEFKELGFMLQARYVDAEVINAEVNRGDLNTYYLGMEMLYVNF